MIRLCDRFICIVFLDCKLVHISNTYKLQGLFLASLFACRKYFHSEFLSYKARTQTAPFPKLLSFYAILLQVNIFEQPNDTN